MRSKSLIFLALAILAVGCAGLYHSGSDSYINVKNTKWIYVDTDASYTVIFKGNGHLKTTNPNDKTPDNDFWEQEGAVVRFNFNNKYSNYEGHFAGCDTIRGTGRNSDESWDFQMTRKK